MANLQLQAQPLLGSVEVSIGENRIKERDDLALVSLAIPMGEEARLKRKLKTEWQIAMPSPTQSSAVDDLRLLKLTADQLIAVFPSSEPMPSLSMKSRLEDTAYVTDQSDNWVVLEISGPQTVEALERICPLDLSPSAFPVHGYGRTVMEHLGAIIIKLDDETYLLMSASSSARSFLHAVETSYWNVV